MYRRIMEFKIRLDNRPVLHSHGIGQRGKIKYRKPKYKAFQELIYYEAKKHLAEPLQLDYDNTAELSLKFLLKNRTHGDLDNMAKSVIDGLEGALYSNDKFIKRLVLEYEYSDEWAIEVKLKAARRIPEVSIY